MSTGLTTSQPRGLALQTIAEAMSFGKMLANSAFVPKDFRGKPEDCVLAVQHGAELGLGPMQSVQSIAVVNGRPSIYGDAAIALAKASPVCEYISERVEGDGEKMVAICEAKRRGDPQPTVSQFSAADAKKAGLWGKGGPWTQYPRRMLQMRARGFALRDAFPDVLRGLVTAEEAADYTHVEPVARDFVKVTQQTPTREPEVPVARETPSVYEMAQQVIEAADTPERLKKLALMVHRRQEEGKITDDETADLLDRLDERLAIMEEAVA